MSIWLIIPLIVLGIVVYGYLVCLYEKVIDTVLDILGELYVRIFKRLS